jgi:hypothetical protein
VASAALRLVPPAAEPPPCRVCRAAPGDPHDPGCSTPVLLSEARPDLWLVERHWRTHDADVALEACNRRALAAWFRSGRTMP